MKSKMYKIILTPIDGYFFGGEITFGEGGSVNYYAKSNLFPQETSLLGMLRFEILKKNNKLSASTEEKGEVIKLIGKNSFNINDRDNKFAFGAIQKISPVFLGWQDEILYKAPFNYGYSVSFDEESQVYLGEGRSKFSLEQKSCLPYTDTLDAKKYSNDKWLSISTGELTKHTETDIFLKRVKIGITKQRDGRVNNQDCFFKMEYRSLNHGYHFVFFAELDSELVQLNSSGFVHLGADLSVFKMDVEECDSSVDKFLDQIKGTEDRILFVSDAFVSENILGQCKFSWVDTVPFRNLTRNWCAGKNYAALNKEEERSHLYNLIKRGSVLYFDSKDRANIVKLIDNEYLNKCGYNIYK